MKLIKKIITRLFPKNTMDYNSFQSTPVEVSELDGVRSMHIGSVTIQSSMKISDPYELVLDYTKVMALASVFLNNPSKILCLGLGGGTMPKFFYKHFPKSIIKVIEINPQVINIAKYFFNLPEESINFKVIQYDGIVFIKNTKSKYDLVLSDVFESYGLPDAFSSISYFKSCKNILSDQGIFLINLWGSDPKTILYIRHLKSVFNHNVVHVKSDKTGNIVVMAFKNKQIELKTDFIRKKIKSLEKKFNLDLMVYFNQLIKNNSKSSSGKIGFN